MRDVAQTRKDIRGAGRSPSHPGDLSRTLAGRQRLRTTVPPFLLAQADEVIE